MGSHGSSLKCCRVSESMDNIRRTSSIRVISVVFLGSLLTRKSHFLVILWVHESMDINSVPSLLGSIYGALSYSILYIVVAPFWVTFWMDMKRCASFLGFNCWCVAVTFLNQIPEIPKRT